MLPLGNKIPARGTPNSGSLRIDKGGYFRIMRNAALVGARHAVPVLAVSPSAQFYVLLSPHTTLLFPFNPLQLCRLSSAILFDKSVIICYSFPMFGRYGQIDCPQPLTLAAQSPPIFPSLVEAGSLGLLFFPILSATHNNVHNPFRITSFADPHPLTPIESYSCKKQGGWGTRIRQF